jgi:Zn-dependent protease with chaperone function
MAIKQMLKAIRVGIRRKLLVCILVLVTSYLYSLTHDPYVRLASIVGVLLTSELMIMLWVPSFINNVGMAFAKKGVISWQVRPEFKKLLELAESQGVHLNKKKPIGIRKNFDNAYANPLTKQIVIGDKLIGRLKEPQLVALTAHEIAHIKRNHQLKTLIWTMSIPTFLAAPLVIAGTPTIVLDMVFYASFFITFLFINWHNEYDADHTGATVAGFASMVSLFKQIVPKNQWKDESETHPSIMSRIFKLKKRM